MNKKGMTVNKGVIYILTNPSFPEYVKIGYATNLEDRLASLNRSVATPLAFRAYAIYEVDQALTDKRLHDLIDSLNPELRSVETFDGKVRRREFFRMSKEDAFRLLECIAQISGTRSRLHLVKPEGHELAEERTAEEVRKTAMRAPFAFSMVGIKPGEEIVFKHDKRVVLTVVDDKHVRYKGEVTSLSAVAKELLKRHSDVQGPLHFTYRGETLTDLRDRLGK